MLQMLNGFQSRILSVPTNGTKVTAERANFQAEEKTMSRIGRKDLILLLIGLDRAGAPQDQVNGVTRLQKLLFLLEEEAGLRPAGEDFEFTPWKAGPYSSKLYDDLEFLENLGLLEADSVAGATEAEVLEASEAERRLGGDAGLDFEYLMGSDGGVAEPSPGVFEERRFRLTQKGVDRVKDLQSRGDLRPVVDGIRRIKSRYSNYSLNDLLYHVYTKYPQMTVASEIKDKVLSRGRR